MVPVAATEPHCRGGPLFKVPGHHRLEKNAGSSSSNSLLGRVIIPPRHKSLLIIVGRIVGRMSCLENSTNCPLRPYRTFTDRVELSRRLAQLYCSFMPYQREMPIYLVPLMERGISFSGLKMAREGNDDTLVKLLSQRVRSPAQAARRAMLGLHLVEEGEVDASSRPKAKVTSGLAFGLCGGPLEGPPLPVSCPDWAAMSESRAARQECRENPRDLRRQEGWDAAVAAKSGRSSVVRAPLQDWVRQKRTSGTSDSKVKPRQEICPD